MILRGFLRRLLRITFKAEKLKLKCDVIAKIYKVKKNMAEKVKTELPEGIMDEIEHWAEKEKMDESTLMTKIVEEGLST